MSGWPNQAITAKKKKKRQITRLWGRAEELFQIQESDIIFPVHSKWKEMTGWVYVIL